MVVFVSVTQPDKLAYILAVLTENNICINDLYSKPLVPYGFSNPVTTFRVAERALEFRHVLESLGADIWTSHEQSGQV